MHDASLLNVGLGKVMKAYSRVIHCVALAVLTSVVAAPLCIAQVTPIATPNCDSQIRGVLLEALNLATKLPKIGPIEFENATDFDDLRSDFSRLIPDIAVAFGTAGCKQEAAKAIEQIDSPKLKKEAEWHLGVEYAAQGDLESSAKLIEQFTDQDSFFAKARYALALAYLHQGSRQKAKNLIEPINLDQPMTSDMLLHIHDLIEYGVVHPELSDSIRAVADPKVFWKSENDPRFLLIDELRKRKKQRAAEQLINDIITTYSDTEHLFQEVQVYIRMNALEKARNLVLKVSLPAERVSLYVQISNAAKTKEFSKNTLRLATNAAAKQCDGQDNDQQCSIAWLNVARGYANIGDIDTALQLIHKPGTDAEFMLSEISRACSLRLDLPGARRAIGLMHHDISNSSPLYQSALEALAIAEARQDSYSDAQATWRNIPNSAIQATIIVAVAAKSPPPQVLTNWLEMARSIANDEMQARSVQALMAALTRSDGVSGAQKWLRKNAVALRPLVAARASLGIAQGALGIVPGKVWLASLHL